MSDKEGKTNIMWLTWDSVHGTAFATHNNYKNLVAAAGANANLGSPTSEFSDRLATPTAGGSKGSTPTAVNFPLPQAPAYIPAARLKSSPAKEPSSASLAPQSVDASDLPQKGFVPDPGETAGGAVLDPDSDSTNEETEDPHDRLSERVVLTFLFRRGPHL
jgi:hypothetical protein